MNCEQGDIAIVLAGPNKDRWVRVIEPGVGNMFKKGERYCEARTGTVRWVRQSEGFVWLVEPLSPQPLISPNVRGARYAFMCRPMLDAVLRPIRDPGNDAVDEMVLRKPLNVSLKNRAWYTAWAKNARRTKA